MLKKNYNLKEKKVVLETKPKIEQFIFYLLIEVGFLGIKPKREYFTLIFTFHLLVKEGFFGTKPKRE